MRELEMSLTQNSVSDWKTVVKLVVSVKLAAID